MNSSNNKGRARVSMRKTMLLDFVNKTPWAIMPEKLDAIHNVLLGHYGDSAIDLGELEAAMGIDLGLSRDVVVQEGASIIPIHGLISKRANLFQKICGGTSTEIAMRQIGEALEDPDVKQVILDIDSGGGSVDGTKELVDFIYESRGQKPIKAFINGTGASAAYWIASAADEIVAYDTTVIGSVGVYMAHVDMSQAYEKAGVKKTYVYAGKYKVAGNEAEPLTTESAEYIQGLVDAHYSIFVESVARNRGMDVDEVVKRMADGRVFIGKEALNRGFIDRIDNFRSLLVGTGKTEGKQRFAATRVDNAANHVDNTVDNVNANKEEPIMNLQQLVETYPGLVDEAVSEATAPLNEQVASLNERISALASENKTLTKSLSILEAKSEAARAEGIMDSVLTESSVSENLHAKVRKMVDYRDFVGESGKFDDEAADKFTEAFRAEVSDWEASLPKGDGVAPGVSEVKEEVDTTRKSSAQYVDENKLILETI